jgi:carbon storage regulator CsrA
MLVLARRLHERIIIPSIHTAIEVTAVKPGFVRLGIEAPPDVTVLREEVYQRTPGAGKAADLPDGAGPEARLARARHVWRHRLNNLTLGLALLRQQTAPGAAPDAGGTLDRLEAEIRELCRELRTLLDEDPPAAAPQACSPALTVEAAPAAHGSHI